jgi:hypothetical protein
LFITFTVIIVTLVGQGLALPWVIRKIKPDFIAGEKPDEQQLQEMELELYNAAINKLKAKYPDDIVNNFMLKNKHELYNFKIDMLQAIPTEEHPGEKANQLIKRFRLVMMEVIEHERRELHHFRRRPGYDDDMIRTIENRLDLEEERLEEESE